MSLVGGFLNSHSDLIYLKMPSKGKGLLLTASDLLFTVSFCFVVLIRCPRIELKVTISVTLAKLLTSQTHQFKKAERSIWRIKWV